MKKLSLLSFLLLILAISGCEDIQVDHEENEFVPGEVWILFSDHITLKEGHDFLRDVSLSPIDLSSLETDTEKNWALIRVPIGEEEYWLKQLIHYPFIESAQRNTREVTS